GRPQLRDHGGPHETVRRAASGGRDSGADAEAVRHNIEPPRSVTPTARAFCCPTRQSRLDLAIAVLQPYLLGTTCCRAGGFNLLDPYVANRRKRPNYRAFRLT